MSSRYFMKLFSGIDLFQIELPHLSYKTCLDFQNKDKFQHICEEKRVRELCPVTCDSCTEDSSGQILLKRKPFVVCRCFAQVVINTVTTQR